MIEMKTDYYQDGFGTVIDFIENIRYSDIPKLYGYTCLIKMDNGRYAVARHGVNAPWGFDQPSIFLSNYDAASTYWEGHKAVLLKMQEAEKLDFLERTKLIEIKN